jgi:hypothetical protein
MIRFGEGLRRVVADIWDYWLDVTRSIYCTPL